MFAGSDHLGIARILVPSSVVKCYSQDASLAANCHLFSWLYCRYLEEKVVEWSSEKSSHVTDLLLDVELDQQCEDRTVLCYVYYYLARILSDTGSQGLSSGGGIPTPNWDALADIDAVGGVTRADVVPRIVDRLTSEALNVDVEFHPRRLQALKALTYAPSSNSDILSKLYEIVFGILDKVADPQKRKKGIFGTKELTKRVSFSDPVAVGHSLEILSEIALSDPYAVAMALGKLVQPGDQPDVSSQFSSILYQLLLDPSERVCFEAILCVLGKIDNAERFNFLQDNPDLRLKITVNATINMIIPMLEIRENIRENTNPSPKRRGTSCWMVRLTREIIKLPEAPSVKETKSESLDAPPPKSLMINLQRQSVLNH
ncbi:hypothetical protein ACH5RR_006718 [Cinchona calisaya]|uniref:Uncharacterized protein n=1 Tax=Cinchona calisaya TaxID=153742 RepID=A0ABD3APR8_9GENT